MITIEKLEILGWGFVSIYAILGIILAFASLPDITKSYGPADSFIIFIVILLFWVWGLG